MYDYVSHNVCFLQVFRQTLYMHLSSLPRVILVHAPPISPSYWFLDRYPVLLVSTAYATFPVPLVGTDSITLKLIHEEYKLLTSNIAIFSILTQISWSKLLSLLVGRPYSSFPPLQWDTKTRSLIKKQVKLYHTVYFNLPLFWQQKGK